MMRRLTGLILLALGVWLFWGGLQAVLAFTSRGGPLMSALMEPPTSLIRLVGSGFMAIGGLLAVLRMQGGGVTGLIGAMIFLALGGLLAMSGVDASLWQDELIHGGIGVLLAALILTVRRT